MALNDGNLSSKGNERFGVATGDPRQFETFYQIMEAFKQQVTYLTRHAFIQDRVHATIRPGLLASPLQSCLHDLCMQDCQDIQQGQFKEGIAPGFWDPIGLGTAIDSLSALKKLIYDDAAITMDQMLDALANNFEGMDLLHRKCLNAPKFGNNDPHADEIGRDHQTAPWKAVSQPSGKRRQQEEGKEEETSEEETAGYST